MEQQTHTPTIDRARLKGILAVRSLSSTSLAAELGISQRHLELVAKGARTLSPQVAEGIERILGADAWRFVTGETHTLPDCRPEDQRDAA